MSRLRKAIASYNGDKYRELDYGTIYFVAGTESQELNASFKRHIGDIQLALNTDNDNWIRCELVYLNQDNILFPSHKQASLFSPMLPTDMRQEHGYEFFAALLDGCEPEQLEYAFGRYFKTLQQMFDEVLDAGKYDQLHLNPENIQPLAWEKTTIESDRDQDIRFSISTPPSGKIDVDQLRAVAKMSARPQFTKPSRLIITDTQHRFLLLDYDREIHFTPQVKALYLLFLNHPEGIRMKEIEDYKEEYRQLFFKVTDRSNTDWMRDSVERLISVCNPNALNVKKSQCDKQLRETIPEESLRKHYEIEVIRGEPHKINLDRSLVSIPYDLCISK